MRIKDIFKADIARDINPVVKVGDKSEDQLREELDSYVVTESIERYLEDFLGHYAETRMRETDHIGAWLYGFVGAGKSHLAKIVGLLLGNPAIAGRTAIERFKPRIQTCRRVKELERLLFEINNSLKTEVISFHINSEANQAAEDNICKIFYRVFLRHLGFSEDLRIASVEQTLLHAGKYDAFKSTIKDLSGEEWETIRRPDYWDLYRQDVFSALAKTLPDSYSSPDDAQSALESKQPLVTFHNFAERVAEYVGELAKGDKTKTNRLLFVVDELGAFIADSGRKLHDVGTLAEEFAKVGKGSIWIFATGHDSLKDLVDNAREYQADFKWLEGRFKKQFTLTAENIEVVLEERLFKKSVKGETELKKLYHDKPGAISELGGLIKTSRSFPSLDETKFIASYPFRPYQLILVPEILHSIRTAGGRSDVLAGATRSLLGITQGVLSREENAYMQSPIGKMVPFDHLYAELQDVDIPHQIRTEINRVNERIPEQEFPLRRLLQTLYLIQQLDYVPTSSRNLALLMADHVDANISELEAQIIKGLDQLRSATYVVQAGGLYKYISGEERNDAELVEQKKAEVKTIHRREKLKEEFLTSQVLPFGVVKYQDKFSFDVRVICDGRFTDQGEYTTGKVVHGKGILELRVFSCLSAALGDALIEDLEVKSLSETNVIYWLSEKSTRIEELLRTLIGTENAMRPIEADAAEPIDRRKRARRYLSELEGHTKPLIQEEIRRCLRQGHIIFQGHARSIPDGSADSNIIFNREVSACIPKACTQFDRAKYQIVNERKTIEMIFVSQTSKLKSIESHFGLFDDKGDLKRNNTAVADIWDYLDRATVKGIERVTGDALCRKFGEVPYCWDPNLIRVIAAAMFRSNLLTVKYENATYRDYRVEEAKKIFMDSRRFNRSELTLEAEEPPSPAELQTAREEMNLIFKVRPQETPSAIAESLEQAITGLLDEHARLQAWVSGSQFPANESFARAPSVLNELIETKRPNAEVKKLLEKLTEVRGSVESVNKLADFYDSAHRKKFGDLVRLLSIGRFLSERVTKGDMPNTVEATDFLSRAWNEKDLLDRFPEALALFMQALPELQKRFDHLRSRTVEAAVGAMQRLSSFREAEGLSKADLSGLLAALQKRKDTLEKAQFNLHEDDPSIQTLWGGVSDIDAIEERIRREIEIMVSAKKGKKPPKEKRRTRLYYRSLQGVPRVIRDEEDLRRALDAIERAVKDALEQGNEVELE